jgi:hypothetical protein
MCSEIGSEPGCPAQRVRGQRTALWVTATTPGFSGKSVSRQAAPKQHCPGTGYELLREASPQQAWLQLGEPFAWFQLVRRAYVHRGVAAFAQDRIHLDWDVAPALHLHAGPPGARWVGVDQVASSAWVWPVALFTALGVAGLVWSLRPAAAGRA